MHKIKKIFYLLILVMVDITAIGYAQEKPEQLEAEPGVLQALIGPVLIILAVGILLVVIVYIIFRTVQQWRTMHKNIQSLLDSMQEIRMIESNSNNSLKQIEIGQTAIQSNQQEIENSLNTTNRNIRNINSAIQEIQESTVEEVIEPIEEPVSIDYQQEVEKEIRKAEQKVLELQDTYQDGQSIILDDIETVTQRQKILISLNWMEHSLREWIGELEGSGSANDDLIQTLKYANRDVRDKLKEIRGDEYPTPRSLEPAGNVATETDFHELKILCHSHVAHFEGVLYGYEMQCPLERENYEGYISQFMKDRLFNGVAKYLDTEHPPEQLRMFLSVAGYEIIPLEIGKTVADAHYHDIQKSRQTSGEHGTIVEIILPGLRRISDGVIVQKPVVVRGE